MANYRQIHVSIWKDGWFLELSPLEKLLFIYLFSNESANLAGIYKLPVKVIAFETQLELDFVVSALDKFSNAGKVFYEDGIVWVANMRKYHATNSDKIRKRIDADLADIPDCALKHRYISYYSPNIPYRYGMHTPSLKEEEVDEDEEEKEDVVTAATPESQLSAAFVNATGIPELTGGPKRWFDAADEMVRAGVKPEDIVTAVQELRDKNYQIISLRSIVNPAINAMSKRTRGNSTNGAQPYPSGPQLSPEEIRERLRNAETF